MRSAWTGLIGEAPKLASAKMLVTTHCPDCDHFHRLERVIHRGERIDFYVEWPTL